MKNSIKKINFIICIGFLVSACGGGGSGSSAGKPQIDATDFEHVVGITANLSDKSIADPIVAVATQQAMDTTGLNIQPELLTGVETSQSPQSHGIHSLLKRLPQILTAQDSSVLAGIETSEICEMGGSITQNSNTTSRLVLWPGNRISLSANSCTFQENGDTMVINGVVEAEVVSGSFGTSGPRESKTRMNLVFQQFQMSILNQDGTAAVGLDGAMSVLYDGSLNKFTSTSLAPPQRTTLTIIIKNSDGLDRHTISDFNYQYENSSQGVSVIGSATVNSKTPRLVQPLRYRWEIKNKLLESRNRLTAGEMVLTSDNPNTSVLVRFGQTCAPSMDMDCVTVQPTINGVQQPTRKLTWTEFEAL
jgi:hypothetical protein